MLGMEKVYNFLTALCLQTLHKKLSQKSSQSVEKREKFISRSHLTPKLPREELLSVLSRSQPSNFSFKFNRGSHSSVSIYWGFFRSQMTCYKHFIHYPITAPFSPTSLNQETLKVDSIYLLSQILSCTLFFTAEIQLFEVPTSGTRSFNFNVCVHLHLLATLHFYPERKFSHYGVQANSKAEMIFYISPISFWMVS